MIVKCTKTGKILASEEEMREHAEAFGVASFEEIKPDETMIWMNQQTGKYCFTKSEMDVFCKRTGEDPSSFPEISVSEYLRIRSEKTQSRRNDPRVEKYANDKFVSALVDVKGFTVLQAEKALWFTKNESLQTAEAWLRAHMKDADFNLPIKLGENDSIPESATPGSSVESVPLSSVVSEETVSELTAMGFSRQRSMRAVWKTDNSGVPAAVDWLTAHAGDADIDDPLPETVVGKPKLSREEAQLAALELQRKFREERLVREAQEARDKEKERILQTKSMLENQALMEEQKRKRDFLDRERLKREEEAHKAELAEKLRLDFIERFGYEPPKSAAQAEPTKPKDKILALLNKIKKEYPAAVAKDCLSTLRMYLNNIASDSSEVKFHKIKMSNKFFTEKISPVIPAIDLLAVCGFVAGENSEFLEIKTVVADGFLCRQAVQYIDVILGSLPPLLH